MRFYHDGWILMFRRKLSLSLGYMCTVKLKAHIPQREWQDPTSLYSATEWSINNLSSFILWHYIKPWPPIISASKLFYFVRSATSCDTGEVRQHFLYTFFPFKS